MTTTTLSPLPVQKFFDNNGVPLASGKLFTYAAGTATPAATYTDSTGLVANANPVILNARGEAQVWIPPNTGYKYTLTDSNSNTIWTVDQITNAQLITLYGGVDTGSANLYLLNFASPFSTYQNGEVIYWTPSNSNTGPATVNVNGLGVIPIVNIDGSALGANQIVAGTTAQMMYYNGVFQLLSIGSLTGVTVGTFGTEIPLASASTVDLGTAPAHNVLLTGTTAITSFGTSASVSAPIYILRFASSLTLTYNSVSMILPGNASIVSMAGDAAIAEYLGSGNWKVLFYQSSGGQQNSKIKASDTVITSSTTVTPDPDLISNTLAAGRYSYEILLIFDSVASGAGFKYTNGGTAIDSRGAVPVIGLGVINAAAVTATTPFYGATVAYSAVSTTADSNQILLKGSILVGTPGTFGISWAQNTSTASATTLRAGSYMTLTLLNTGAAANMLQRTYTTAGAGTETVPTGYSNLVVEVYGASGGGGSRFISGSIIAGGGGGGSGGYCRTNASVVSQGGNTIAYNVGAAGTLPGGSGGNSTIGSGTFSIATATAGGGTGGGAATSGGSAGAGGTFGTATGGGVTNTPGKAGSPGQTNAGGQAGGTGGFGIPGIYSGGAAGGAGAGFPVTTGFAGGTGIIVFTYT